MKTLKERLMDLHNPLFSGNTEVHQLMQVAREQAELIEKIVAVHAAIASGAYQGSPFTAEELSAVALKVAQEAGYGNS